MVTLLDYESKRLLAPSLEFGVSIGALEAGISGTKRAYWTEPNRRTS